MYIANGLTDFWHFFFNPTTGPWFTGNVWGNMVAWIICGVLAIAWGSRKFIKWNRRREAKDLALHEALKAHVDSHMEPLHAKFGTQKREDES